MSRSFGTYDIPRKFSGENRFLKVFTGKAFKVLLVCGAVGALLFQTLMAFGPVWSFVGLWIGIILALVLVPMSMIKVPENLYLYGSGKELDTLVIAIIRQKIKRVIYTRCAPKGKVK